jgi:hypothetical protein
MIIRLLLALAASACLIAEEPAVSFSVVDQSLCEGPVEPPKDLLGRSPFAVLGYDHVAISRDGGAADAPDDDLAVIARIKPLLAGFAIAAPPADFAMEAMFGDGAVDALLMKGDAALGYVFIAPAGPGVLSIFKQDGMVMYYLEPAKP